MKWSAIRPYLREPLYWFLLIFSPIWLVLLALWLFADPIGEWQPVLSLGVIETILTTSFLMTLFWFVVAAVLNLPGRGKWLGLALLAIGLLTFSVWGAFNLRPVFDGDMRPSHFEWRRSAAELQIEAPGQREPLKLHDRSFPQFLGPGRDLKIDWLKLDRRARPEDFVVLWRREMGYGWSGFTAVDGLAITCEQHGPYEVVSAYQIADGQRVWLHETQRRHEHPAGGIGPRSTVTFHDNYLYVLGAVGTLSCLTAHNGQVVWQRELTEDFAIPVTVRNEGTPQRYDVEDNGLEWGRAASPLIVDDLVVVPVGGPARGDKVSLAAFDRLTGQQRWTGGQRQIAYGSPALVTLDGQRQIVLTNESTVNGYDPATGQELWSHNRPGSSQGDANTSQPLGVAPNQLLLTKEYGLGGELIQLTSQADGTWRIDTEWEDNRLLKTKLTVAAIRGDYAYALSSGILECVNWKTGERQWRGGRYRHGQLLLVDDLLLIMSEDGDLNLVAADPDEFIPLVTKRRLLSGRCWNTLCIYEDLLLARSEIEAVCVRLPTRASDLTARAKSGRWTATNVSQRDLGQSPTAANRWARNLGSHLDRDDVQDQSDETEGTDPPPRRSRQQWLADFEQASAKQDRQQALAMLDGLLQQYPNETFGYYQRGCLRSWEGDFAGSVADFDRYVELRPEVERRLWERGIAYYFNGQFEQGANQFELYQTYHDNDVENSVWRYLCQIRYQDAEQARRDLLPIRDDPRQPLMEIYRLFRGEAEVADVLAAIAGGDAIEQGDAPDDQRRSRQFYGHYYLGLYYETLEKRSQAIEHLKKALEVPAESPRVSRYMWDIAKVHLQTLEAKDPAQGQAPEG